MKIKINNYPLADGALEGVSQFKINGQRVSQVAQFLRAAAVRVFNRGNLQTTVTFAITRAHESLMAAELFILEHDLNLPPQGLVTFTAGGAETQETERYLADAMITVSDREYIGVTTIHHYTVVGGELLKIKPT